MTFDYTEKNVHTPSFMKFYSQVDWKNQQILNVSETSFKNCSYNFNNIFFKHWTSVQKVVS